MSDYAELLAELDRLQAKVDRYHSLFVTGTGSLWCDEVNEFCHIVLADLEKDDE
jgi:hypothetical protein